jgi:hypothetical protein
MLSVVARSADGLVRDAAGRRAYGQDAALVQTVWPATWQHVAMALPSPHSQHALAGMNGWQAPATQT